MSFHYRLYGLHLASDLELPELNPAPPALPAEIRIVLLPFAPDRAPADTAQAPFQAAPGIYRFTIKGIAHYEVAAGQRILVDPLAGAAAGDVRLWLLGTALGALLHQRGLLPLHVSALALEGAAVAFA